MNYKKRNNEFGFTLVEVMVAAGLIGVLSVALVNMIGNINRTSKRASQVFNIQQEIQRMSGILADQDSCEKTFTGESFGGTASGSSFSFNQINRSDGPNPADFDVIYQLDQELGGTDGIVHIEEMTATTTTGPGPVYLQNGLNVTKVDASIRVRFQKGRVGANIDNVKKSSAGATDIARDFPVSFVVNAATGAVVSCYGSQNQFSDAVCDALGGEIDANGDCTQVELKSRVAGTVGVALDYSAQVGSNTASQISLNNSANVPLRVHNGGNSAIVIDDDTIQATTGAGTDPNAMVNPLLNINPYGPIHIGGRNTNPLGAHNTSNIPMRVYRGTSFMGFTEDTIQPSSGASGLTLKLAPFSNVEVGGPGSQNISSSNILRPSLKVRRGTGAAYLGVDENAVQAFNGLGQAANLYLNPYGLANVYVGQSGQTSHLRVYGNIYLGDPGAPVTTRVMTLYDNSYLNFTSDERLKKEIVEIDDVLSKLDHIRGVEFVWRSNERRDIGYIAQDIEKVFPEVVERDEETGMLNVQYTKMPAINTAAIKELRAENQELKFRVNLLMKALCEGEDAYKYEDVCALPLAPLE